MSLFMFAAFVVNAAIAWTNCYLAGTVWCESRAVGGPGPALVWAGAVLAACGFSLVCITLGALVAFAYFEIGTIDLADPPFALRFLSILVALAGLAIAVVLYFWSERMLERRVQGLQQHAWLSLRDSISVYRNIDTLGLAFGDTRASMTHAGDGAGRGWSFGGGGSGSGKSRSGKGGGGVAVAFLVVLAICGGIILTIILVRYYAGRRELPLRNEGTGAAQQESGTA